MIEVQIDQKALGDALRAIGLVGPKARYAASLGINRTLNEAQDAIRAGITERFTLRRKDFILRTIYRKPGEDWATKDNLRGAVRVNPEQNFLAKFEEGGLKTPRSGRALAVPVDVRRNKADIIPRNQSVRALLASGKAFIHNNLVLQRTGSKARGFGLTLLYIFKPSVHLNVPLKFVETGIKTIQDRAHPNIVGAVQVELDRGLSWTSGSAQV
jgi:hypothetical protein